MLDLILDWNLMISIFYSENFEITLIITQSEIVFYIIHSLNVNVKVDTLHLCRFAIASMLLAMNTATYAYRRNYMILRI